MINSGSTSFTVVIPAYQEEKRIGQTLEVLLRYLSVHHPRAEVVVVCSGSDQTGQIARRLKAGSKVAMKVLEPAREGKGAAVRAGVAEASGEYILFTDADLAYSPELFGRFLSRLRSEADMAVAERMDGTRYASWRRNLLTRSSRYLISTFVIRGIADTQAGLKGFRRDVARDLFDRQSVDRFLFDVEILLLARRAGYRIEKIPVVWEDKTGSTVRPFRDLAHAALDMTGVLWRFATRRYERSRTGQRVRHASQDSNLRPTS